MFQDCPALLAGPLILCEDAHWMIMVILQPFRTPHDAV